MQETTAPIPTDSGARGPAVARVSATLPRRRRNPVEYIFGPVFMRDARVSARKSSTYSMRAGFVIVLLAILVLVYVGLTSTQSSSPAALYQRLQSVAPYLAVTLLWCQVVASLLITANVSAVSLGQERVKGTLAALATAPMPPLQVVLSTLAARLIHPVVIALLCIPVLVVLRAFGGIDLDVLFQVQSINFAACTCVASMGIFASMLVNRATAAATFAVVGMLVLAIGPLILVALLQSTYQTMPPGWVLALSPLLALLSLPTMMPVGFPFGVPWIYNPPAMLAVAAGFIAATVLAYRRLVRAAFASEAPARLNRRAKVKRASVAAAPAAEAIGATADFELEVGRTPTAREAAKATASVNADSSPGLSRELSDYPVLWRELRTPIFQRRWLRWVTLGMLAIFMGWAYALGGLREPGFHMFMAVVGMVGIIALSVSAASGAITGEAESRTLPLLLTAPLTARAILYGKALGAAKRQWLLVSIFMLHFVGGVLVGGLHPVVLMMLPLIVVPTVLLCCTLGVFASLIARKTNAAGGLAFFIAALLWIGPTIVYGISQSIFEAYNFRMDFARVHERILLTNPVYLMGETFSSVIESRLGSASLETLSFRVLRGPPLSVGLWFVVLTMFGLLAISLAVSMLEFGVRCFNYYTRRRVASL